MRPPARILVIALKYLGDVIVATPALRALRAAWPGARITVMLRRGYADVLRGNPDVDEVIPVAMPLRGRALLHAMRAARRARPEMTIALEPGDKESFIGLFSGAPVRVAPDYQAFARLWTVRVPVRENSIDYRSYYLAIAQAAGAPLPMDIEPRITVSAEDAAWGERFVVDHHLVSPILGIHPGAREANKRWAPERFAEVIDRLVPSVFASCVVMSGPGEDHLARAVAARTQRSVAVAEGCTIGRTASIMRRCAVCVTNDSAPRHIAAAVGTRTVAVMRPEYERCWTIYDSGRHALVVAPAGSPDFLAHVAAEEVVRLAASLLASAGA